jgi:putative hemolysin
VQLLHYALKDKYYAEDKYRVYPRKKYMFDNLQNEFAPLGEPVIPSLLAAYLKAGARVAGDPAFDRVFKCADFFTLIRTRDMSLSIGRETVS